MNKSKNFMTSNKIKNSQTKIINLGFPQYNNTTKQTINNTPPKVEPSMSNYVIIRNKVNEDTFNSMPNVSTKQKQTKNKNIINIGL